MFMAKARSTAMTVLARVFDVASIASNWSDAFEADERRTVRHCIEETLFKNDMCVIELRDDVLVQD